VGTAFGVLMGLDAWLGLATLVTWAVVAYTSRYLSLAVVIASISAPVYYTLLFRPDINLLAMIVINALLLWRHARNIAKLLDGKERRIGDRVEADL
jgi:glycerol-3-phosphate acyltransferase PlsY